MDNVNKKSWLVKLRLFLGDYEKTSKHLVEAETEDEAIMQAYRDESHCDDAGEDWQSMEDSWEDDNGGMAYIAIGCVEVPWDDAVTLRKYL